MGMAPLGLLTFPVPLNSLLGMARPLFLGKTGSFCICCAPKFPLFSLQLNDCRFVEDSFEMGLSQFGGSCSPRA